MLEILFGEIRDVLQVPMLVTSSISGWWNFSIFLSIDWFKGKITGKSHISWENPWFTVDFPLSQPIDSISWEESSQLTFIFFSEWWAQPPTR